MKKTISLVLFTLIILSCFSACSSDGTGKQMVTPIDSSPQYLDPQIVSEVGARNIIANCFEGLVTVDENGNIIPAAAESYDIDDSGLVYTFYLRKNANWKVTSDAGKTIGEDYKTSFDTAVTAKDFVFGFRRALRPETKSPYASMLFCIKNARSVNSGAKKETALGVKAVDDYTLRITLERQDADFLYNLTCPACMPCSEEFFELTGGRYGLSTQYLIYNGPFYISSRTDNAITVKKSDAYHSPNSVLPSSVYFSINNEQETRAKKLRDGTYDTVYLTEAQASLLESNRKITLKPFQSSVLSLMFNCSDTITSNVNIRRAISQSLDEKPLLELTGLPAADGIIPSGLNVGGEKYREKAASLDLTGSDSRAKEYLKNGLSELEADDIELTVLCLDEYETAVRAVMQKWQSLFGVSLNVSVESVDYLTLKDRLEKSSFQLALADIRFLDSTAYGAVLRFTSDSRDNFVKFSDAQYDALVRKIKLTKTTSAAVKAIEQAESYLISDAVILPVCESDIYFGIAEGVSGLVFSPAGDTVYYKSAVRK